MRVRTTQRVRAWLVAAIAVVVVGIYLVAWTTYARLHLPPERYTALPPGAAASQSGVEFVLLSLQQTERLADTFGAPKAPAPGAVWVVARLEATVRTPGDAVSCTLVLVDDRRRTWDKSSAFVSRTLPGCVPDAAVVGQPYPIEAYFQVPAVETDRLVGVAVEQFSSARDPLLTPTER